MIGDVIFSLLSNDATVSGIVGVKIFPSIAMENIDLPYIVYEESDNQPTNTKDGKSELDVVSYDIEIYSSNPTDLSTLSYAVRNCLDRYTGIVSGKRINSIKYVSENTGYSLEDRLYLRMHNYDIRFFPLVETLKQPTNLAAVGNTSDITLTWVDNAVDESGYKVYRGTTLYNLDLLATIAANLQTYVDSTAVANTVYYYYVVPYSFLGNGYASDVVAQKLGIEATYTIKDSADTTLYSGSIASGGNLDQTITDSEVLLRDSDGNLISTTNVLAQNGAEILAPDGNVAVNGDAYGVVKSNSGIDVLVRYENGTPVGTIVSGVVEIPNPITPSGIAYCRPQPTGQTTSYRTGDDAWRQINRPFSEPPANPTHLAELSDFFTLKNNNAFGNTLRFTNLLGGVVGGGDSYFIDNHTGQGWLKILQGTNTKTWNNSIDEPLVATNEGYEDWYLPDVNMLSILLNQETSYPFGYAPLNLFANRNIWTSTTAIQDTTNAWFIQHTNTSTARVSNLTKGAFRNYYMCRNHF